MLQGFGVVVCSLFFFQGLHFVARIINSSASVCNSAGPFGVPLSSAWLLGIMIGALGVIIFFWWKSRDRSYSFGWLVLWAAGMSNVLERVQYGCVFDYFRLPFLPVFNAADVALTASVVFLVWREYRHNE